MVYSATSSYISLFVNMKLEYMFIPWKITVDLEDKTITIEQRNWFLIGKDYTTIAFRFIRSISINEHIVGADITIKVLGNTVTAYYISKGSAKTIKQILIDYNQKNNSSIIFT